MTHNYCCCRVYLLMQRFSIHAFNVFGSNTTRLSLRQQKNVCFTRQSLTVKLLGIHLYTHSVIMGRFNSPSNSSTSTDNNTMKWPPRATLGQIENANRHLNGYHSDNALGLQHFYSKGIFCIRDDLSDFKKGKEVRLQSLQNWQ